MSGKASIPTPSISYATPSSSLWDRLTDFASRNRKTIIYTTAAFTILFTAGGVWYYTQRSEKDLEGRRKREKRNKKQKQTTGDEESQPPRQQDGKSPKSKMNDVSRQEDDCRGRGDFT